MAAKSFDSMVQDLVYNVDVGGGYRIIKTVLYILLVLTLMLLYTASQFDSFTEPEAMEYAQLGRNLARDGKLVTQVVRPGTMSYLMHHTSEEDPRITDHPDIIHPPLYPALLATVFKLTGSSFETELKSVTQAPEQWIVVPLGHLFTLLTGVLVWLIGRRLFDNRVGLLAMTLFYLSDSVWRTSISGLDLSLATFLATAAFYFALVTVDRRRQSQEEEGSPSSSLVPFVASIVLCILAFLTRYAAVVIVPAVALFYALQIRPNGWKWGAAVAMAFILGIAPWMIRNQVVSGGLFGYAPTTVLEDTRLFPDDQLDRTFEVEGGFAGLKSTVRALQIKWLKNIHTFYNNDLRSLGEGLLICFFLVTFFYRFARAHTRWFRWCLALAIVLLLGFAGFFGPGTIRGLHLFLPFVLVYGTAFFFILLDRLQFTYPIQRIAVTTLFVLLAVAPLVVTLMPPRKGFPYPPYLAPYQGYICSLLETNEVMCTDMPWATAWYGDRTSILLPRNVEDFYLINDEHQTVDAFYFTLLTRDRPFASALLSGSESSWFPLQLGQLPPGFPPMEGMPMADKDQLFLARSKVLKRAGEMQDTNATEDAE